MPLPPRAVVALAFLALDLAACRIAKDTASGDPARWHLFTVANGDSSFIDTHTLRDSAGVRRAWIRTTPADPPGRPAEPVQYEFDCTSHQARTWVAAGPGGDRDEWRPWQPVAPESYAETALEAACALAPVADPT
jgi:hypothetical protein